jgi:hypothetical protein
MELTGEFSVRNRSGIPLKEVLIVVVSGQGGGLNSILGMSKIGAEFLCNATTRGAMVKWS